MVTLKALKSVFGDYSGGSATGVRRGLIHEGEIFQAKESDAEELEAQGIAERVRMQPYVRPAHNPNDFKMTFPPENKAFIPQLNKSSKRA